MGFGFMGFRLVEFKGLGFVGFSNLELRVEGVLGVVNQWFYRVFAVFHTVSQGGFTIGSGVGGFKGRGVLRS